MFLQLLTAQELGRPIFHHKPYGLAPVSLPNRPKFHMLNPKLCPPDQRDEIVLSVRPGSHPKRPGTISYCTHFSPANAPLATLLVLHSLYWWRSSWARSRSMPMPRPMPTCSRSLNWIRSVWMLTLHVRPRTKTRPVSVHPQEFPFNTPS